MNREVLRHVSGFRETSRRLAPGHLSCRPAARSATKWEANSPQTAFQKGCRRAVCPEITMNEFEFYAPGSLSADAYDLLENAVPTSREVKNSILISVIPE